MNNLETAVVWAAKQWYGDDWHGALARISKAGVWGLKKRQMFTQMVRDEYSRLTNGNSS